MSKGKLIHTKQDYKSFYYQYVSLISPMLSIRKQEAEVLSQLLFYNYKYRDLEEDIRMKMIFDYDTKTKIRYDLKNKYDEPMSVHNFHNILTSLRKKGIIISGSKQNKIKKEYLFIPDNNEFMLSFKWSLNDTEETEN